MTPISDMIPLPEQKNTPGLPLRPLPLLIVLFSSLLILCFHLPVSAGTLYAIRVASYNDQTEAVKKVNHLKKLGHNAFIKTVNLKGKGTWHRVYIEQYDSRSEAVKEARVFKKLELIKEYGIDPIYEKGETSADKTLKNQKIYYLHVSSFQEKANAEKTVDILRTEGQKAFYVKEEIKGKDWFRVYVGEFNNEQSARKAGSTLKEKGLISYFKPIEIDRNIIKHFE